MHPDSGLTEPQILRCQSFASALMPLRNTLLLLLLPVPPHPNVSRISISTFLELATSTTN